MNIRVQEEEGAGRRFLNAQQREQNCFQLMIAHKDNLLTEIKCCMDCHVQYIKGYIDSINYHNQHIVIVDKPGHDDFTIIPFHDIMEVFI